MSDKLLIVHPDPGSIAAVVRQLEETGFTVITCTLNVDQVESLLIQRALEQTQGNVARAARLLGINRSRIYRKFKSHLQPATAAPT